MSIPTADNIVYNLTIYNSTNDFIQAERYISRDQPFIEHTEKYYLRLLGVSISSLNIPLFNYDNDMVISIDNGGIIRSSQLTFEKLFFVENEVIFIDQFLLGVNNSLQVAHVSSFAPGNPPKFIYDNETVTLIVDRLYDPLSQHIIFNRKLSIMFPALYCKLVAGSTSVSLKYGDFGNTLYDSYPGGTTYPCYVIPSMVKYFKTLQEFDNIIVTTASIPINKQNISNPGNITQTLGILDIISLSYDNVVNNTPIMYTQFSPSYIDFLNRGSLSEIDFKVFLVDKNYKLTSLMIAPGESVTCRFEFINKELVKAYYPLDEKKQEQINNFLSLR